MNQKLTFQLVAPFIISALLFAVFWIVGFIFGMSGKIFNVITLIDIGNFFAVNPFKIEGNMGLYWVVNIILIFFAEMFIAEEE